MEGKSLEERIENDQVFYIDYQDLEEYTAPATNTVSVLYFLRFSYVTAIAWQARGCGFESRLGCLKYCYQPKFAIVKIDFVNKNEAYLSCLMFVIHKE